MRTALMCLLGLLVPGFAFALQGGGLPQPDSRAELIEFLASTDPHRQAAARGLADAILIGKLYRSDINSDALAQDLVELAVSNQRWTAKSDALAILIYAGNADRTGRYLRSFEHLAEIFNRSNDVRFKSGAMGGMIDVATEGRVLEFLKPIAGRLDPAYPTLQSAAIALIAQLNTNASVAFLRDLDRSGTVTVEWASRMLKLVGSTGYRAPRPQRVRDAARG